MKKWEWEVCDCRPKDLTDFTKSKMCGCGENHCRLYRDKVIHWISKHWRIECAFDYAAKLLEEIHGGKE